jgi:hypothetical protein
MSTNIEQYINSGILEAYVIGAATPQEEREILHLKETYPQVREALFQLELDIEAVAQSMAVMPPPGTWDKIEAEIDGLIAREQTAPNPFTQRQQNYTQPQQDNGPQYINVESESNHMRIHKVWKWVFAAVFVLGKIFLGTAIYFYLENRQAQLQIKELKTEIQALK